jgi:predicted Zn-dependent protease
MLITCALLLAMGLQAAPAPDVPADPVGQAYYLFIQGRVFEDRNDLASAIASFRQALELLPRSAAIHVELANLFAEQNQMPDARTEAEAALAIDPENHDAHRILGWLDLSTLDRASTANSADVLADAITHLEHALSGGPSDAGLRLALGQLYLRQHDTAKAEAMLQQLLAAQPGTPAALRVLAQAYTIDGRTADLDKTLSALDDASPDSVELRVGQIEALEQSGQWSAAASAWGDLIGRDATAAIYRTRYALALANSGKVPEARQMLASITKETPKDISAWYLAAQLEARAGNGAAAEQAARQIAGIDPEDARGPLALAAAKSAQHDYKAAVQALDPRVKAAAKKDVDDGTYAEMVDAMYQAYGQLHDTKRGLALLETAARRVPDDVHLQYELGSAYDERHQYDRAEAVFRSLIGTHPTFAQALNYLGYMLAERGRKLPEAVDLINRALAIDKDNPAYLDSLGLAYYRMGDFEKARDPLERAAAALPKVSVIQEHLGDVYLHLQRYGDAASAFDRALAGDRDDIDPGAVTHKRDQARRAAK